ANRWADLSTNRAPARYRITDGDSNTREFTLAKGNRIILDALLRSPVYCASPVRISDRVCILRREFGVPINKEMFDNDAATGRAKFGVYFIGEGVERIGSAA
ncbi:MAG: hypothetical protein JKY94_11055, partial [Rhodobacteraceae bacterium]|nr:hypothetical protein [Paracoccaceae bacterium]